MNTEKKKPKTHWHEWFAAFVKIFLSPVGLDVKTDLPVMSELPEADVIIINKHNKQWTKKQLERLPDGITQSKASHILIELKYTESLNEESYCQTCGYYKFYKNSNNLKSSELDIFIISSKTPSKNFDLCHYTK
jgi:predicted nucleic-acid-binding Zn-ribbon protein